MSYNNRLFSERNTLHLKWALYDPYRGRANMRPARRRHLWKLWRYQLRAGLTTIEA